jgi:hypothetical protein
MDRLWSGKIFDVEIGWRIRNDDWQRGASATYNLESMLCHLNYLAWPGGAQQNWRLDLKVRERIKARSEADLTTNFFFIELRCNT